MATQRPVHSYGIRPRSALSAPDPFEIAARRFEVTGAALFLRDPVRFATECFVWPDGEAPTSYQLSTYADLQANRRVATRGPHGLGKTTTAAQAVLWFAITREAARIDWKAILTAGSWHQLTAYLWPEIHKWAGRLRWDVLQMDPWRPERELLTQGIRLRHGAASAASPGRTELIEGAHADELLFVFDESKAIPTAVFDAAEGALSGTGACFALMQSTPGPPQGRFFEVHSRKPGLEDWKAKHVTLDEAIAAGRVSRAWADQRRLQWGEESAIYRNRVLGEFHQTEADSVVPLSWIDSAVERWHEWNETKQMPHGRDVYGIDVARGGADLTAIAHRIGHVVRSLREYNIGDTTKIAVRAKNLMVNQTDLSVVDTIGVGAGVVDIMRRWGLNVHAFNASRKSKRRDRIGDFGFVNQRSAMWWLMRESLDPSFDPTLCLPPDENLAAELSAPKWRLKGDKVQVESKDDIRERLGRSTDRADATCQTLLTDSEWNDPPKFSDGDGVFAYTDGREDDGVFSWS